MPEGVEVVVGRLDILGLVHREDRGGDRAADIVLLLGGDLLGGALTELSTFLRLGSPLRHPTDCPAAANQVPMMIARVEAAKRAHPARREECREGRPRDRVAFIAHLPAR